MYRKLRETSKGDTTSGPNQGEGPAQLEKKIDALSSTMGTTIDSLVTTIGALTTSVASIKSGYGSSAAPVDPSQEGATAGGGKRRTIKHRRYRKKQSKRLRRK